MCRCATLACRTRIRWSRATRIRGAIGYHFNFDDPLQFANLGITAAYTPDTNLPSEPARPHRHHWPLPVLDGQRCRGIARISTTCSGRPSAAAKATPRSSATTGSCINDEPRKLDLMLDFSYYDQIDTLPNAQNVSTNFTRLVTGEVRTHYTDVRRSLGAVDDEKGIDGALVYKGSRVSGEITPQFRGELDRRHSAALAEFVDLAANRGRRRQRRPQQHRREFLFRRIRQQLRRRQVDQALSRLRFKFPGFGIDEISALSFVREMGEWNLPPCVFEIGGYTGLLPELAATVGVRGWAVDGSGQRFAAQRLRQRGRAGGPALQRPPLVRHDAFGRLRGRLSGIAASAGPSGWSRSRSCR